MDKPIENYWKIRLKTVKEALAYNHFKVYVAENAVDAKKIVTEEIIPAEKPGIISWGGSMTFTASGIYDAVKDLDGVNILDTYEKGLTPEQFTERRRQSLLADLYITGTNAITEDGQLVNLDMIGNRVGAIGFGPKSVIILVGRNKIVADLEEAMFRIKNYAAPTNVMRLGKKTPCSKTSRCEECNSPDRICNVWTIHEKSFPKERIKVVLINESCGL